MSNISLIEQDNFIDNDFCDFFIGYIQNSKNKIRHRNTSLIKCDTIAVLDNIIEFKILLSKLTFFVKKYFIDTCQELTIFLYLTQDWFMT